MRIDVLPKKHVPEDLAQWWDTLALKKPELQPIMYRTPAQCERFDYIVAKAKMLVDQCSSMQLCLDVGCAEGLMTTALARFFPYVVGWDFSPVMISRARKAEGVIYQVQDVEHLPPETGTYDLVVCSEVLEHLHNPTQILSELSRRARYLIVSCPITEAMNEHAFDSELFLRELRPGDASGHIWAHDMAGWLHMYRFVGGTLMTADQVGASVVAVFQGRAHEHTVTAPSWTTTMTAAPWLTIEAVPWPDPQEPVPSRSAEVGFADSWEDSPPAISGSEGPDDA